MKIFNRDPDASIVMAVREAEARYMEAQAALSRHLAEIANIKSGCIVVHRRTKRRYRVAEFSGNVSRNGEVWSHIRAYLTYANGRPEASSPSWLLDSDIGEVITPSAKQGLEARTDLEWPQSKN